MKLPEDKKERTQIIVLIVIVSALALYGLFQVVLRGLMAPRKERRERIAVLEQNIREASLTVRQSQGDEQRNRELIERMREYSDRHLLRPRLGGNLSLGANEKVKVWFREAGLDEPVFQELGRRAVEPARGGDAVRDLVHAYSARVSFKAGLHDVARVMKTIEDSDPCVTVVSLSVTADPKPAPDMLPQHDVAFVIQWPIWRDDDFRGTLEAMLQ